MSGVWPLLSDEQRTFDTGFRKCHCSPLERLTFAPLAPSPRVPLASLAAHGSEQTPQGPLAGRCSRGRTGAVFNKVPTVLFWGAPGEGESPELCNTHPRWPLSPIPAGHRAQTGLTWCSLAWTHSPAWSLSGAHHLSLCLGSEELCWLLMSLGCRRCRRRGWRGGWLMHNAALCKKPVSELNSQRSEKLSACQMPVNCRAAVTG